jgi:hypothetical protein
MGKRCLPERTSSIAVYALTGAEPIEVTLDKYCINLFFGIARLDSTIEKQIFSLVQLATFLTGHGDLILIMRILFVCPSLAFHQG